MHKLIDTIATDTGGAFVQMPYTREDVERLVAAAYAVSTLLEREGHHINRTAYALDEALKPFESPNET